MFSQRTDDIVFPPRDDERAITYQTYKNLFRIGEIMTRKQVAERAGKAYSTAVYHLERAVGAGLLNKQYGFSTGGQPGWLYALPETMPRLFEYEGLEVSGGDNA